MDGNLATTYTLIHAFLTKHSHTKAALAVKKAAKEVVVLKDDIELEGPQLDEIIKEWKISSQKKEESSSDSDSDSNLDSSSSSGSSSTSTKNAKPENKKETSSSDDSDSDSKPPPKKSVKKDANATKFPVVKSLAVKPPSASSSSSSSSSGSDSDDESSDSRSSKAKKKKLVKKKATSLSGKEETKVLAPQRDSSRTLSTGDASSSKSGSDSDSSSKSGTIKTATTGKKAAASKKDSPDSSSSSSSSSEESDAKKITTKLTSKKRSKKSSSGSSDSSSSSDSDSDSDAKTVQNNKPTVSPTNMGDDVQSTKKRRTDIDGSAVVTATSATSQEIESGPQSTGRIKAGNGKAGRAMNERFQRVNPTKFEPIANNHYLAKHAPENDYGKRAHEDLIVTRGAGFRKEKNKKKKGSYRGGEITMQSHSFKFT